MNGKDKLIALFGVFILVVASIGIYVLNPSEDNNIKLITIEDFFDVSGSFSCLPTAISVSDSNPFFVLIATPLAVHYGSNGKQEVLPLYIKNTTSPSKAIKRAENKIGIYSDLFIDNSLSAKAVSLSLAETFWKSSEGAIIIKENQSGYNLGVIVSPLASYLSIPIIVADRLDDQIKSVFRTLGVKKSIVCGDIDGYGKTLIFQNVDDIVNASIELVKEKFGCVEYITLTNPIDTRKPDVLDSQKIVINPIEMQTISTLQIPQTILTMLRKRYDTGKAGGGTTKKVPKETIGTYKIPHDYKYALIKFEGTNLNPEDVDLFGDTIAFHVEGIPSSNTGSSPSKHDSYGKTVADSFYTENVLYDMGGRELAISVTPGWARLKKGKVKATIVIEKLSDPLYPMMKGLSSVSPYLTACHKGIIFGKSSFAFTADDDVLTEKGETCPGVYVPRPNKKLQAPSNEHIYNNIHKPVNKLLAKLADIPVENLEELREYYQQNPVYIALVGGTIVLPQFIYDAVVGYGGTPSDIIYGNIDPEHGWKNLQNDKYTYYPYQENIVGRITGWDVQDASALIARTLFYNKLLDEFGDWKNQATVQTGWGTDFAKPKILYKIKELLGGTDHVSEGYKEPLRWPTGYSELSFDALQKLSLEPMGFKTERLERYVSSFEGLSWEAINKLKRANLLNLILLSKWQLWKFFGEDKVRGGETQEKSNFIIINGHGGADLYVSGNEARIGLGFGHGLLSYILTSLGISPMQIITRLTGLGPGASIGTGVYNVRSVENMDLGPSFIFFATCLVGAIDGRYPKNCLSQAYLHAGANAIIVATTPSNVAGGYLEPYQPRSTVLRIIASYILAKINARRGIYPEHHFGEKLYGDILEELKEKDTSVGMALRDARNRYLPEDANFTMYWTPPLGFLGLGKQYERKSYLENKYINYQEFLLYGDPAFNPYEPCNLG